MAGMYLNDQVLELFGEQVAWPGLGVDGKYSNGSFTNPEQKPSFVPAQAINLILDNLAALIQKAGGEPNAVDGGQLAALLTNLAQGKKIIQRDDHGRAKVAAPQAEDDIARLAEITAATKGVTDLLKETANRITPDGFGLYQQGRDLLAVLGMNTIPAAMAEIRRRCNNNGEIGTTKIPDFSGIMIGDYIDGIDLSGIAPTAGGDAPQAWNNAYKNNRIVVAGFNTYKSIGNPFAGSENTKNHILFAFRNCIGRAAMNRNGTNIGGYPASEMRSWLEGASGDGSGAVAAKLKQQLGGGYLYTISKLLPTGGNGSGWTDCSLWLPTELEIFGMPLHGAEGAYDASAYGDSEYAPIQIPLYQKSWEYRIKRWNGIRHWYFLATPRFRSAYEFCLAFTYGTTRCADEDGGVSPAFCVA